MNGENNHNAVIRRQPILSVRKLTKRYGAVTALNEVDLDVYPHQILAIVGDNGAGKSTLIKMMSGMEHPDEGVITIHGQVTQFSGIRSANEYGITAIFQEPAMCPAMTIADNIFMGREIVSGLFVDRKKMVQESEKILHELGSSLTPQRLVRGLSGGERKTLSFAQAMLRNPEILLLDEPTASLSVIQTGEVLDQLLNMQEAGKSLVVVCHDLTDVFAIADRICVMRHGEIVAILSTASTTYEEVIGYMAGMNQ